MTFAKCEYFFAKVINGVPGVPEAQEPKDGYFLLATGRWQVTVIAYDSIEDTEPLAAGTSDTFTVNSQKITQVSVQLVGKTASGAGSFSYCITYPEDVEIITFTMENLLEQQAAVITISGNGEAGGGVLILSGTRTNVPAGYYYLSILLKKNGEEGRTSGANEVVHIYDKLDSEYSRTFTEEDFSHIHKWSGWTQTDPPTETADGSEARTCTHNPAHIETRTAYATGTPGLEFQTTGRPAAAYSVSKGSVSSGTVYIPALHRANAGSPYLPVTEIAYNAFYNTGITSVTIPASVTEIGPYAFVNCAGLTGITVEADNPNYASEGGILYNRAKTRLIQAPGAITGTVSISAGVTTIDDSAFSNCASLAGITVDADNPNYASDGGILYNRAKTLLIQAPGAITDTVNIPAVVTSIGSYAFSSCGKLSGITLPPGVTSIGEGAFNNCANLTTINIPAGVTSIGSYAFSSCGKLSGITLPSGVTSIGDYAFQYCTSLATINIPAGVTSIGSYAFSSCGKLSGITLPATVTSIGEGAFNNCSSLATIDIPAGVTSIGSYAFSSCGSLATIDIPAGVTSIGSYAFSSCGSLTSIAISASVTSIGEGAFDYCDKLSSIIVAGDNPNYASEGGILYNKARTRIIAAAPAGITGTLSVPASITSIGFRAFYNCTGLTGITLPASVTSIGDYAFYNCTGLTGISIPANVTSIGDYAFYNCTGLTGISLPASVTSIGYSAFYSCGSLTRIEVNSGNSWYASEGGVLYNKTKTELIQAPKAISGTVTIPASVTTIGPYAFYNCTSLSNITIPATVTSINYDVFYHWTNAQTINIMGYASRAEADAAWGSDWRSNCSAVINYLGVSIGSIVAQVWRENASVSLAAPQINDSGGTITAQGWQISDNGSGGWSNFTPPSTANISHNGKYLRYYAANGSKMYYSNTVTIFVISQTTRVLTIEMMDSKYDGWDGAGALRIVVNGTEIASNVKLSSGISDSYTFNVNPGNVVAFYWIQGSSQNENAFAVYYSDYPPNPAFNPANGAAVDTVRILLYRQYDTMNSIPDGALLGSFTVP